MKIEKYDKSLPFCSCGDSMTTYKILGQNGGIEDWIYYCIGCDEWYKLVLCPPPKPDMISERVCLQCKDMAMHKESEHGKHGCEVKGCGCKVVNIKKPKV